MKMNAFKFLIAPAALLLCAHCTIDETNNPFMKTGFEIGDHFILIAGGYLVPAGKNRPRVLTTSPTAYPKTSIIDVANGTADHYTQCNVPAGLHIKVVRIVQVTYGEGGDVVQPEVEFIDGSIAGYHAYLGSGYAMQRTNHLRDLLPDPLGMRKVNPAQSQPRQSAK